MTGADEPVGLWADRVLGLPPMGDAAPVCRNAGGFGRLQWERWVRRGEVASLQGNAELILGRLNGARAEQSAFHAGVLFAKQREQVVERPGCR